MPGGRRAGSRPRPPPGRARSRASSPTAHHGPEPGATRPLAARDEPATTRAPIDSSSAASEPRHLARRRVVTMRPVIAEGTPYRGRASRHQRRDAERVHRLVPAGDRGAVHADHRTGLHQLVAPGREQHEAGRGADGVGPAPARRPRMRGSASPCRCASSTLPPGLLSTSAGNARRNAASAARAAPHRPARSALAATAPACRIAQRRAGSSSPEATDAATRTTTRRAPSAGAVFPRPSQDRRCRRSAAPPCRPRECRAFSGAGRQLQRRAHRAAAVDHREALRHGVLGDGADRAVGVDEHHVQRRQGVAHPHLRLLRGTPQSNNMPPSGGHARGGTSARPSAAPASAPSRRRRRAACRHG